MKKVLLGTTALFAAAALASPAVAADKIKLGLGGYYVGSAAYVDTGDLAGDNRDYTFGSDSEIHVKGEGTLDNGLKVGFKAELELERDNVNSDEVDEVYVYISGGFGRLEFGQQDGVGEQMHVLAPNVFQRIVLTDADLSPTEKVTGGEIDVYLEEGEDYTKIIYMTPRIAGFQAGVSFAPEGAKNDQDYNGFSESDGDEIFEAAINFDEEWNDVGISLSAAYLSAAAVSSGADEPNMYAFGGRITYAGFAIGGGYSEKSDLISGSPIASSGDPAGTTETQNWEAGVTYAVGPWTFGVGYASEEADATNDTEQTKILGGFTYKLGPGVQVGLGVEHGERDFDDNTLVDDVEATAVFTEFGLSF